MGMRSLMRWHNKFHMYMYVKYCLWAITLSLLFATTRSDSTISSTVMLALLDTVRQHLQYHKDSILITIP